MLVLNLLFVGGCGIKILNHPATNKVDNSEENENLIEDDRNDVSEDEENEIIEDDQSNVIEEDDDESSNTKESDNGEDEVVMENVVPTSKEMELLSYAFRNLNYIGACHLDGNMKDICTDEMVDSFMWGMTLYCNYDFTFDRFCELAGFSKSENSNSLNIEEYNRILNFLTFDVEAYQIDEDTLNENREIPIEFYTPINTGERYASLSFIDGKEGIVKLGVSNYENNAAGYNREDIYTYTARVLWDDKPAFGYRLLSVEPMDTTVDVLDVTATSTLEDSTDYQAMNLVDGDFSTAWVEGADYEGKGETVTFTFDREYTIVGMLVTNGYTKTDATFVNNNRVKTLAISRGDTRDIVEMNSFISECEYFSWEGNTLEEDIKNYTDYINFDDAITTDTVELEILDAVEGEKYNDTCISEIVFIGY